MAEQKIKQLDPYELAGLDKKELMVNLMTDALLNLVSPGASFAKGLAGKGFLFGKKGIRIPWTLRKTDVPLWDSWIKGAPKEIFKKLDWMTPDEYIARIVNENIGTTYSGQIRSLSKELIGKYKEAMLKKGTKFPTPVLEYRHGLKGIDLWQEGRHRAVAAKEAGLEKIPVWLFEELLK